MRLRRGGLSGGDRRAPSRMTATPPPRTFVGGVGYTHLRDYSAGTLVAERLERLAESEGWPAPVAVGDLSYDPVKIVHWLTAEDPPIERLILVSAVRRGRTPGEVHAYRWDRSLPEAEQIQIRVSEAVTGVIHLDNLLVVLGQFLERPPEILVVEIEPEVEEMGDELTPDVARGAERATEVARRLALDRTHADLRTAPIGGVGSDNGAGHG